jgi:hypothetical protein
MRRLFGWGKSDMGEHRVSMLGMSLRRFEDPAHSADPRIRQLVAQLATLEPAAPPRAHFRAELRAQLVAVAPRLVAEGAAIETPLPTRQPGTPAHAAKRTQPSLRGVFARTSRVSLARPLGVLTAIIALFAVVLGGAVWASKKALPGESLYALKRANENTQLAFATGDTAKGREYLNFAKTRTDEIAALLQRSSSAADGTGPSAAAGINSHTATLITSTLDAADKELRSGAQLLGGQAVRSGSTHPLNIMTSWAPGQVIRLQRIANRMPAGSMHDRAEKSTLLVAAAYSRANALRPVVDCKCLTNTSTDQLGPVPCTVCAASRSPGQTAVPSTGAARPTGNATSPNPNSTGSASQSGNGSPGVPTITGTGSGAGSSGGIPSLPIELPSLQIPPPTDTGNGSDAASPDPTCTIDVLGICIPL